MQSSRMIIIIKFIYTLDSEVKLCSVVFTGSNELMNKNIRKIKKRPYIHKIPTVF